MRTPTLDDIATLVGVSAKTVSRVVNNDPRVSPETRNKIEEAIAQSGYLPNPAARSLATARSRLIGLFAPPTRSHFYSELIRAAMRACRRAGYNLTVEEFDMRGGGAVETYIKTMRNLRCEGVILPSPICDDLDLLEALERDGVRHVRISPFLQPERSLSLVADHAAGARAVAEHFWSLGHRRFGVIAGLPQPASSAIRRDAFIAAVVAAGGSPGDVAVVHIGEIMDPKTAPDAPSLIDVGRAAAHRLLTSEKPPRAISAFNDELAAGAVVQARELGITVPGALAVAGFDDSDAARLCWPALTTVRQPIEAIADAAVSEISCASSARFGVEVFPVQLIVRASSQ